MGRLRAVGTGRRPRPGRGSGPGRADRATATFDGACASADDGALSPIAWLLHHTQLSKARADRLVRCGRLVRRHERTAKVLAAGEVTCGHVEVLADKTRRHADRYADHEDVLLDAAVTLGVDDFKVAAEKWRLLADEERADREKTGAVEHAESTSHRRSGGATRSAATWIRERRAEALVEMAAASLAARSPARRSPTTADIVIDLDTLRGDPPAALTKIRCDLSTGDPVTREADAHHLQHWVDGGPTDLDNLCLLCRRHHVMVREGGWTLSRDPVTGAWTAERAPPWYDP
jgi:HNH endonuclease